LQPISIANKPNQTSKLEYESQKQELIQKVSPWIRFKKMLDGF